MRRTGGALVLLAALGGCTSTGQESDAGKKVAYDYRQQLPRPSDPSWMQNSRNAAYMNGQVAPYTRIGPGGAMPQATTTASQAALTPAMSQVASAQMMTPPAPTTLPTLSGDATNSLTKAAPAAAPSLSRMATDKPSEHALVISEPATTADPSSLKNAIAATIARSDAKTAEILNGSPLVNSPALEKVKDMSPGMASKAKPGDMLLAAGYPTGKVPDARESRYGVPPTRVVNNKRITLNYKINDVGPSGVSGIDVWVTHDSRIWKKLDVGTQTHPPCVVEVGEEGVYGFTLVAKNGLGLGKAPPQPGEAPQVWVDVDLTKPMVHLLGVDTLASSKPTVAIRWSATDKSLGPKPITISYADYSKGPWMPVATGVENSGRYVWQVPTTNTGRFLVRVEAADLAGNVGLAQTVDPVIIDISQPSISILNVEAGSK